MVMKKCPECGYSRLYQLADGRHKCKRCGHR
ncbi:MAG: transposase, partial [Pseudomonadota bacterium]